MTGPKPEFRASACSRSPTRRAASGKTTTAINLGTALAAIGERVLIIDLDPQGNASTGLGIAGRMRPRDGLRRAERRMRACSRLPSADPVPGLHVVPANADLVGLEAELHGDTNRGLTSCATRSRR